MVDKLISWIVRLLKQHGYIVLKEDERFHVDAVIENHTRQIANHTHQIAALKAALELDSGDLKSLFDCLNKLDTRLIELEKWRKEQPEHIKQASEYTLKELIGEWAFGEGANDVAE